MNCVASRTDGAERLSINCKYLLVVEGKENCNATEIWRTLWNVAARVKTLVTGICDSDSIL